MEFADALLDVPTLEDLTAVHQIYSDPRVWAHRPDSRHREIAQTESMLRSWINGWEQDGLSAWVVRDSESGAMPGHVGCSMKRSAFWNLGYRLAPEAHGRGLASRVATHAVKGTRPRMSQA